MGKDYIKHPHVTIKLTTGTGEKERVPESSGLNWGQRPGRNPNQGYLSVPADIQRSGFFPDPGIAFRLITDDGIEFLCARAQQNGKAIHSSDNSQIGSYFRERMGIESGELITLYRLLRYGRTNMTIYKKSNGVYIMDFSTSKYKEEQISS